MSSKISSRLHFDLTSLRLLIATAELGSLTAAAADQHLTVTAASRRIAELEEQLGVALFKRARYGMNMTEAGTQLLGHARQMMKACQSMQLDAYAFAHGNKGVVRVAACTSAVLQFLPGEIREFLRRYPDIRIDLQELDSHGVADAVTGGRADIGVLVPGINDAGLSLASYRRDEIVVVVSRAHEFAARKSLAFSDLLACDFVDLPEGTAVARLMRRLADRHDTILKTGIRVRDFASMLAMVAAGIGVGLMPRGVVEHIAGVLEVEAIPLDDAWARRDVKLCRIDRDLPNDDHVNRLFQFLAAPRMEQVRIG